MANNIQFDLTKTNVLSDPNSPFSPLEMISQFVDVFEIFKIILIIFMIGYIIVSAVVLKQIYMMTSTIKSHTNPLIIMLGYINLIVGILILFLVLFIH